MGAQYNPTVRSQSGFMRLKTRIHRLSSVCYISTRQTVGRSRIGTHMVLIRGKSGLQWTGCQVTPGRGQREQFATESATENRPPSSQVARVKRWGKSPKVARQNPAYRPFANNGATSDGTLSEVAHFSAQSIVMKSNDDAPKNW